MCSFLESFPKFSTLIVERWIRIVFRKLYVPPYCRHGLFSKSEIPRGMVSEFSWISNRVVNLSIGAGFPSRNPVSGRRGKSRCVPFHLCITRDTRVLLTSTKWIRLMDICILPSELSDEHVPSLGNASREMISGTPLRTSRLDNIG